MISLGIGDPDTPPPLELREEIGRAGAARRRPRLPVESRHRAAARGGRGALRGRASASSWIRSARSCRCWAPRRASRTSASPSSIRATSRSSPTPGYPVYYGGPALAGGEAIGLPLRAENGFLPDLDAIRRGDSRRANLLICGYPNNPTGAVADVEFFQRLAAWGRQRGVAICHDNAYAELTYDGIVAPSFLSAPGAREAGIEIYSLSKSLSMPGWRVAFAVGNAELIGRLRTLKTNIDAGMWLAMQHTAIRALEVVPAFTAGLRELYGRRRDLLCDGLDALGARVRAPERRALRVGARCRAAAARSRSRSACSRRPPSWSAPARPTGPRATATCACRSRWRTSASARRSSASPASSDESRTAHA